MKKGFLLSILFASFFAANAQNEVMLHLAPRLGSAVFSLDQTIDLGQLLGTAGNQNYEIPADVNLAGYNSLVLFSPSLNLIMSYAAL